MRARVPWRLLAVAFAALLFLLATGPGQAVQVLFKDGFLIRGRITQPTQIIVDRASGKAFPVPVGGAAYTIDDDVRRILFSPGQVFDVLQDPPASASPIVLKLFAGAKRGDPLPAGAAIEEIGPWNNQRWERTLVFATQRGRIKIDQRLTLLTPDHVRMDAVNRDWTLYCRTRELSPEVLRGLLKGWYSKHKDNEAQVAVKTARFFLQAGWTDLARKELDAVPPAAAEHKEADQVLEAVRDAQAREMLEALQTAHQAGQYQALRERLAQFFKEKMDARVEQKQLLKVQELRTQSEAARERLTQAERLLKVLAGRAASPDGKKLAAAVFVVAGELHPDNLGRLQPFLDQARGYDLKAKEGQPDGKGAERLLALAVSGWVLGNDATEESPESAAALWQARAQVLQYQKTPEEAGRAKLRAGLESEKLPPDVVARLIRLLPPPDPPFKLASRPVRLVSQTPEGANASAYEVQVPPEYSPQRPCPVLIVLHRAGEAPVQLLKKWSELADRHGFILAAPDWAPGRETGYYYSEQEHAAVLNCLYDLRRRFQVDSDRVFLFGDQEGGHVAYDVGLAHPDQFAGVVVMSAGPYYFPARYFTNAQHLPFYVVDGDRHAGSAVENRAQFKRWLRWQYPVLYLEYRGRGGDWYADELPLMMDWMSRKKRSFPLTELGRFDRDEEYVSMRATDNRFYWLGSDAISERCLNDASAWNKLVRPASLAGKVFPGNDIVVRASGVKQVTVWLAPGMVNFGQKVSVRINGAPTRPFQVRPSLETLLEDFHRRGDRQQLFLAKIALKL
jgi:pimeloyl-ACP methyl ester carboxylesterase